MVENLAIRNAALEAEIYSALSHLQNERNVAVKRVIEQVRGDPRPLGDTKAYRDAVRPMDHLATLIRCLADAAGLNHHKQFFDQCGASKSRQERYTELHRLNHPEFWSRGGAA